MKCLLISILFLSNILSGQDSIIISLNKQLGAKPLGARTGVSYLNTSDKSSAELPNFFADGYLYELDFSKCTTYFQNKFTRKVNKACESFKNFFNLIDEYDHKIHIASTIKGNTKYITIDSDNDNSLINEQVFSLPYNEIVPKTIGVEEEYKMDKIFGVDGTIRNEIILNLKLETKEGPIIFNPLIEIIPYCLSKVEDAEGNDRFSEHLCLTWIEHYSGDFTFDNEKYTILVQNSLTNINMPYSIAIIKTKNKNHITFDNILRDLDRAEIGDTYFDVNIDFNYNNQLYKVVLTKTDKISDEEEDYSFLNLERYLTMNSDSKSKVAIDSNGLVLVYLWGTWCGACKEQFPGLNNLINEFSVSTIGIAAEHKINMEKIQSVIKKYGLNSNQYITSLSNYPIYSYPQYFIFDKGEEVFKSSNLEGISKYLNNIRD